MMVSSTPTLSIIIPAYNEARRLPESLSAIFRYLSGLDLSAEVLVVDDGSTDGTPDIADRRPGVTVIRCPHRGKGFAVRAGVFASRGEFVLLCDADLAVPIEEWEALHRRLVSGSDVAIGSREGLGASRIGEPWYRHLMGRVFNLTVRAVTVRGIRDTQCGFKLLRRQVAVDLFQRMRVYGEDAAAAQGPAVTAYDVELLFLAQRFGYRIAEEPVTWRYGTESKVSVVHDTLRNFQDVMRVRLYALLGRYDSPPVRENVHRERAGQAVVAPPEGSTEVENP